MTSCAIATTVREGTKPDAEQLAAWKTAFHRDGFIFLENVLTPERCRVLRDELDRLVPPGDQPVEFVARTFEQSRANVELFDLDPVVSFAEALIGEGVEMGAETCHVMHNNSFRTQKGGGFSGWHQDDSSHFVVTHGEPPENIHLPCLLMTANYYLSDQPTAEHGPGQAIRGSHRWGQRQPPQDWSGTKWEANLTTCGGPMGSVMLFNNQVWHRGAPNVSDRVRYVTQVSYARKLIAHHFHPFMNYQLPPHVLEGADARRKRLLGFLPVGAYG
jgi:ectoine hydroxylase-related dioxygenase (phytanoyl-CoA dioxygenase family)